MANLVHGHSLKKTPCNNCRQRKRRCSYGNPCERCSNLGVECVYTIMPSPKDLEYMQELEYLKQIELLESQISIMEKEMTTLKLAQDNPISLYNKETAIETDYPSPISLNTYDFAIKTYKYYTDRHDQLEHEHTRQITSPKSDIDNDNSPTVYHKDRKQSFIIAKSNQLEASVTKGEDQTKPWQLTVKNGRLVIDTFVNSYSDLMHSLNNILLIQKNAGCPNPDPYFSPTTSNTITTILSIFMWRKYGKSRFKSITKYKPMFIQHDEGRHMVPFVSIDGLVKLVFQLIHVYVNCNHIIHFAIHVRSFVQLFMSDQQHILRSPAVMAICCFICQQPCKHTVQHIPVSATADYALYFFEQARELLEDRFDEASIEIFTAYNFMAVYKLKAKSYEDASKYLSLAEQIYHLLLPQYESTMKKRDAPPEAKLFARLYRSITHTRHMLDLNFEPNTNTYRKDHHKIIITLNRYDLLHIYPTNNDSERELRFIDVKNRIIKLHNNVQEAAKSSVGHDLPSLVGNFTHQVEMASRYWYQHEIPREYRLSLPLFEDVNDFDFFTALELECPDPSPYAIWTTGSVYYEYLIAAKSFFPKERSTVNLKTEELLSRFNMMEKDLPCDLSTYRLESELWMKLLLKIKHIKEHHLNEYMQGYEGSEQDYFRELISALNPSSMRFDTPSIRVAIISALNLVRLVQFAATRDYSCLLDVRWVMNAWEILLRSSRFDRELSMDKTITPDRIKANMLLCIGYLKGLTKFNQNTSAQSIIDMMEEQFQALFQDTKLY
ncbi:hypothetical protein CU097_011086 [Rhizopus azygosporus]|uniref:Zn(2)-C6 fungal-type domain-containing protein n=2 Tax=Rhizopus TaxID=4842 RepID=A0A367JMC5_RHIAZ|nr:hypothetical protein CU097_011086 [Rhizopus azygosporus]